MALRFLSQIYIFKSQVAFPVVLNFDLFSRTNKTWPFHSFAHVHIVHVVHDSSDRLDLLPALREGGTGPGFLLGPVQDLGPHSRIFLHIEIAALAIEHRLLAGLELLVAIGTELGGQPAARAVVLLLGQLTPAAPLETGTAHVQSLVRGVHNHHHQKKLG